MEFHGKKRNPNPWEKANPISHIFFSWVIPFFRKGYSKDLNIDDLYDCPKVHKSKECTAVLSIAWEKEKQRAAKNGTQPHFWRALISVHKYSALIYLSIISVDELFIRIVQPLYLRELVKSFHSSSDASLSDQILYAAIVCLCSLFHDLFVHQCVFLMFRTGLSCRTSCSSLIYRKAMSLQTSSNSVGHLMNLLSNDVSRFDMNLIFGPYIIVGPFQLVILLYLLWREMGISALAGVGLVLFMMPTQLLNGRLAAKFRESVAKKTDERSKIMNEIVMAISVIKMYAWEKPFSSVINSIRRLEVKELRKRAFLRGFFLSLYTFSTRLTSFFVIMTYVLVGNELTADKAFFCVAISLTIVETMIFYFSSAVSGFGELSVSTDRIEKFLLEENMMPISNTDTPKGQASQPGKIALDNVTASWPGTDSPTLQNLTLQMSGDKIVIIAGSVGAGKTSLLHLLISELGISSGTKRCTGIMSYASQESWIFTGNIRQNILFGNAFDKQRYQEVVRASALEDDFAQLPHGDMTTVGERGITLSGGQKARVNLARALYRQADIYIMDDPLSAVDSRVSRHLFDKCIKEHLKGKLRILVTHQLQYLPQADHIVVLKDGFIHAQGTYEELIANGIDFISLMSSDDSTANAQRRMSSAKKPDDESTAVKTDYEKPADNEEFMAEGSVSMNTYWGYLRSAKSSLRLTSVVLIFLVNQFLLTSSEVWLSFWTDSEEIKQSEEARMNKTEMSSFETSVDVIPRKEYLGQEVYLGVYAGIVGAVLIFTMSRAVAFFSYCLRISNNLHNDMFGAVARTSLKFFSDNPAGRIMNRFTKDMGAIDELLPPALFDSIDYFLQMFGVIFVIITSNFYLAIPTVVVICMFWVLRMIFVQTSRDVKRLESIWKSPVFTHVGASMQGLSTIRALGAQDTLISQFDDKQDIHSATWFSFLSISRCFAVWSETIGILFLAVVTFSFLFFSDGTSGGLVGLVVTSTLALSVNVQWAIRQSAEAENQMTAVERALEYTKLKPEAPLESSDDNRPPKDWPSGGEILFQNVTLRYEEKKDVLKNLNFAIRSKEKIGIVGRTGAGKSSIIAALFRLTEPEGNIFIDGIKINDIGLHDLRKNISIIPQEPILFSGTIRYNLDPFSSFGDDELWQVIQEVHLKDAVPSLDFKVNDSGSNFSVGQRQLVCLARAILRKNKIIVLDEATANVDPHTDEFIQSTIRTKFAECSIITIAHRLHSVMDCDRILVLENGSVMEYDNPHLLLQNASGMLSTLVNHTGEAGSAKLRKLAEQHYNNNRNKNSEGWK